MPTIRSLAKIAKVSNATVSMALRNHPRISLSERKRIQQIAAEAGYKTNALVGHLLTQLRLSKKVTYQSTLGLLYLGGQAAHLRTSPTFRGWIDGCQARALSLGYGLDQFELPPAEASAERLRRILTTRNIRGLLVIGPFGTTAFQHDIDTIWTSSASIVLGIRPSDPPLAFVSNDQFDTAFRAIRELLRLGYHRPGLCIAKQLDALVENRFQGGFAVAQDTLLPENRLPIFNFKPDASQGFIQWASQHRPDVIVTPHQQIEPWIASMGLSVPADMGLAHLNRSAGEERWAGMHQNNNHIGTAAVDMLIGQLQRHEFGVPPFQKGMLIASSWVPGTTIRKQTNALTTG